MKGQGHWIGSVLALLAVASGIWTMQTSQSKTQQTRASNSELLLHRQPQSIGCEPAHRSGSQKLLLSRRGSCLAQIRLQL